MQKLANEPAEERLIEIENEKYIVAIGRLVPQKGYEDMIDTLHLVNQEIPCKLLILGEGPLRKALEDRVLSLGLNGKVLMPGFVKRPWPYLSAATLFLSTSHWEGFSLAHIEAMACEIPLVLTNCNYGPKELINPEKNGILVPVGDVSAIATRLIELLKNYDKRVSLSKNAARHAAKYDSPVIAANYEKMLNKLLLA